MSETFYINSLLTSLVFNSTSATLYPCRDQGTRWCGNPSDNQLCQKGSNTRLFPWIPATFVNTVPDVDSDGTSTSSGIESAKQSTVRPSIQSATQDTVPSSVQSATSSQTRIAIGVGVGLSLSIMVLGGFSFLAWREQRRRPVQKIVHGNALPTSPSDASSDERHYEIEGVSALPEMDGDFAKLELPARNGVLPELPAPKQSAL